MVEYRITGLQDAREAHLHHVGVPEAHGHAIYTDAGTAACAAVFPVAPPAPERRNRGRPACSKNRPRQSGTANITGRRIVTANIPDPNEVEVP